jgi:hypothetical protein
MISSPYQLTLTTPGNCPACAIFLKQMRQIPNLRIYARARPQELQRFLFRVENFGVLFHFSSQDFFAIA